MCSSASAATEPGDAERSAGRLVLRDVLECLGSP